jgi:4-hydroxy-L-threonine phosphate dehydrogenase PdxA
MERCTLVVNKGIFPKIGITMGDASGIGPEIIMKSIGHRELFDYCRPLVIGDAERLREAGRIVNANVAVNGIKKPAQALSQPGIADCIDLQLIPKELPWGKLSSISGDAAYQCIVRAVELARINEIDAICTAPLNKEALQAAGHLYPGHTELLADLTGTPEVSMMLSSPTLRVIHVTGHIGLIDAINRIEPVSLNGRSLEHIKRFSEPDLIVRESVCAASTRMPVSTGYLAEARKNRKLSRLSEPVGQRAGMWKDRFRRTHCSFGLVAVISI